MKPTIGRIVIYRTDGRNGLVYDLPAIITVTRETHPGDYPDGSQNPLPVPESDEHVHLTVFTPGGYGSFVPRDVKLTTLERGEKKAVKEQLRAHNSEAFIGAYTFIPGSGSYVEWNVPYAHIENPDMVGHRTWRWPERV